MASIICKKIKKMSSPIIARELLWLRSPSELNPSASSLRGATCLPTGRCDEAIFVYRFQQEIASPEICSGSQ